MLRHALGAITAVAVVALSMVGCDLRGSTGFQLPSPEQEQQTLSATTPAPATAEPRIVLFAPLALGELAKVHPDARLEWAGDLAQRVTVLSRLDGLPLSGRRSEHLPNSDSTDWSRGRVPGTRTVYLVVLTDIVDLSERLAEMTTQGRARYITATVEMKAIDKDGTVVFRKRGIGEAEDKSQAKFMGPASDPRSRAAWDAATNVLGALLKHIAGSSDEEKPRGAGTIDVAFTSDPPGADIVVDGIYRDSTPATIKLPARRVEIQLLRQGYLPWKQVIEPGVTSKVAPTLVAIESQK